MPQRLKQYLGKVFFAKDDFSDPTKVVHAGRHAVAHGVISDELLDEKAGVIRVLLLAQLCYLLPTA